MKNRQPTPLEHYDQLRNKREKEDKERRTSVSRKFGQTVSVDLLAESEAFEKSSAGLDAVEPAKKFFKVNYQEDLDQTADQFKKQIGSKLKIEGIVADAQQHVHLDNIIQVR